MRGTTTFSAASAGDTFYIDEGTQAITGNTDYSGVNTSVTAEISRGFTGSIGTAAAPWKTAFSTRLIYAAMGGSMFFESNAADTETTALVQCIGNGNFTASGSTAVITRLEAIGGVVTVANPVTVTTARFGWNVNAELQDSGTGPTVTTLDLFGGFVKSSRPHTTINALRGRLVLDSDSAGAANAHGTINAYGAEIVIIDSGTITTLNAYNSIPNLTRLTRALVITNSTINMSLPGAQAFIDNPNVSFSNNPTLVMTDGRQV
jgi:hypothetical protein